MHNEYWSSGAALLILGILLGFWHQIRKFDRTNAFGIEQFHSDSQKNVRYDV